MTASVIFLDVDGVLNDHRKWATKYSPILYENVRNLNIVLAKVPEAKLVLSSSWRYSLRTIPVIEHVLMCHGCDCFGRVIGVTASDESVHDGPMPEWEDKERWSTSGLQWRAAQIRTACNLLSPSAFVVLDDLPLQVPHLVQTLPNVGLTETDALQAVAFLKHQTGSSNGGIWDRFEGTIGT